MKSAVFLREYVHPESEELRLVIESTILSGNLENLNDPGPEHEVDI